MLKARGHRRGKSNWPPCGGCIGGTLSGFTKHWTTPPHKKSKPSTILPSPSTQGRKKAELNPGRFRKARGYVMHPKIEACTGSSAPGKATRSERKALAAMGRRGGKKAAERWKTNPDGKYARGRRKALIKANQRRSAGGRSQGIIGAPHTLTILSLRQGNTQLWLRLRLSSQFQTGRCSVQLSKAGMTLPLRTQKVTSHR